MTLRLLSLSCLGFLLSLTSCSAPKHGLSEGGEISRVKYYRFRPFDKLSAATDAMVAKEKEYYSRGAVTQAQLREREGNYYNVFWRTDNGGQPAVVRFEFLQEADQGTVKRKEISVGNPGWRNNTEFQIVGPEYAKGGDVRAWKATVLQGGRPIATQQSFLWAK